MDRRRGWAREKGGQEKEAERRGSTKEQNGLKNGWTGEEVRSD